MARAVGLGSMFRGRIGSYVGYLTKNARGRYVQSVKSYQPVVSNPQTFAQCLARIPLAPTQRFYSQLAPLIQRGFEGVTYGDASKSEFLSYNLANFRGPYLVRQDLKPRPGPFLIAHGSLSSVIITRFDDDDDNIGFQTSLRCLAGTHRFATIAELTQHLLTYNINLREGEQLTFIWCCNNDDEYHYYWHSIVLSSTDTTPCTYLRRIDSQLYYYIGDVSDYGSLYGAAVIRSQAAGSDSFRRSTTFFHLNEQYYQYNDDEALIAAVKSYMDDGEANEDWPYDPTPEQLQVANICLVDVTAEMLQGVDVNEFAGAQCLGYLTRGGMVGVFYSYVPLVGSNVLLTANAQPLMANSPERILYAKFNTGYERGLEYSSIYGIINS